MINRAEIEEIKVLINKQDDVKMLSLHMFILIKDWIDKDTDNDEHIEVIETFAARIKSFEDYELTLGVFECFLCTLDYKEEGLKSEYLPIIRHTH